MDGSNSYHYSYHSYHHRTVTMEKEIVAGNPVAGFVQIEVRAIDGTVSNGYITMEVIAQNGDKDEENGYCYAELTNEQARKLAITLNELFPESEEQ